jgi:hypothetical protein
MPNEKHLSFYFSAEVVFHSYNRRLEQKLKQMVVDETTTEDVVF